LRSKPGEKHLLKSYSSNRSQGLTLPGETGDQQVYAPVNGPASASDIPAAATANSVRCLMRHVASTFREASTQTNPTVVRRHAARPAVIDDFP
jgi:hypothetical protein